MFLHLYSGTRYVGTDTHGDIVRIVRTMRTYQSMGMASVSKVTDDNGTVLARRNQYAELVLTDAGIALAERNWLGVVS